MSRGQPKKRRKTTRVLQIGLLILLIVSIAQLVWWVYEEVVFTQDMAQRLEATYDAELEAARRLAESGFPPDVIAEMLPAVTIGTNGLLIIEPTTINELHSSSRSRINRLVWEGGFFLLVLVVGVTVLIRALRQEALLRRRQQNVLAAVSHEFKSPLAGARLAAETLALRNPPPEKQKQITGRILDSLDRLDVMVSNILDTVRIEEGRFVLNKSRLVLHDVVTQALRELQLPTETAGVRISQDISPDAVVQADEVATRTIVRNLVDNAIRACRAKSGGTVSIEATTDENGVTLRVLDDGIGFESNEADQIFDKFYRTGDELTRRSQGTGLGLYLVSMLAVLEGANVSARSDGPQRGAEFAIHWPRLGDERT